MRGLVTTRLLYHGINMLLPNRQAAPFPVTAQTQLYELHHCDDAFRIHGHRRAALDGIAHLLVEGPIIAGLIDDALLALSVRGRSDQHAWAWITAKTTI